MKEPKISRKIIIDTDPGIDDAMAIFYALASPQLEVIGLTTVFGNVSVQLCTENALRLLEIADHGDIPVCVGADQPLLQQFSGYADFVHGSDGQGNTFLPPSSLKPSETSAANFIINEVSRAPGKVTIVALGALTNLAAALVAEPALASQIQEIVLMGGNAFVPGNVTPAAEANIFNDPDSADIVFGADCSITMCGLDVTETVIMSASVLDSIRSIPNARARHLARILPFYREFYKARFGKDGIPVHDSTAISYLLAPEIFKGVQHPIRVETGGILSRGKTWPALGQSDEESAWHARRKVNICVEVDAQKSIQMEMQHLADFFNA